PHAPRLPTLIFQWFPLVVFPLIAAQVYSTSPGVDVRIFLWSQRKKADAEATPAPSTLDLRYCYFVICILAASAANVRGAGFYVGATGLTAVALWRARARGVSPAGWAGLLLVVAAVGWAGHVGLHRAQRAVEAAALEWLAEWMRRDTDPFRSSTAIGSLGRLKLSDKIGVRGGTDVPRHRPLREQHGDRLHRAAQALGQDRAARGARRGRAAAAAPARGELQRVRHAVVAGGGRELRAGRAGRQRHVMATGRGRARARARHGVRLAPARARRAGAARRRVRDRPADRRARGAESAGRGEGGRRPRAGHIYRAGRCAFDPRWRTG